MKMQTKSSTKEQRHDLITRVTSGRPAGRQVEMAQDPDGRTYWRIPCEGGSFIRCKDEDDARQMLAFLESVELRKRKTQQEAI